MTSTQKAAFKSDILANPDSGVQAKILVQDWDGIATFYSANASPAFIVWKSIVVVAAVGDAINGTELAGLSSLNNTRLQTLVALSANGLNPSLANRRQFFDDIFSGAGGVLTRASLLALWKRSATRLEKLFATGTGSDASPATLVVEGTVNAQTVSDAMGGI